MYINGCEQCCCCGNDDLRTGFCFEHQREIDNAKIQTLDDRGLQVKDAAVFSDGSSKQKWRWRLNVQCAARKIGAYRGT